jgi:hypothetical protein
MRKRGGEKEGWEGEKRKEKEREKHRKRTM